MIDMEHLNSISLSSNPLGQKIVARFVLGPNYHLFQNVDIRLENLEKIPRDETVIFAMNHMIIIQSRRRGQARVIADALNDRGLEDGRKHPQLASAVQAVLEVDREDALEQPRPGDM